MQYRQLPQYGQSLSAVGIGAMSFSDFYGPVSEEQAFAIMDRAFAAGINHVDTSNVYGAGQSERFIGEYLRQNQISREALFIATKAGIGRKSGSTERTFINDPAYLRAELEKSLERLGVDYIDLFYLHRREATRPIEEVMEGLVRLKEEGLIRGIGLSEIAPTTLELAWKIGPVAAVQSEYSLATRTPELGLLSRCERFQTTFVAFAPVARSLLTDKPRTPKQIPDLVWLNTNPRFLSPNLERNIEATAAFRAYAQSQDMTAAELAVGWVLAKSKNIITIPGTRYVAHLDAHIRAATTPLTPIQIEACETLLETGWAHGDRYSEANWRGPERYC